jgi:hypothetical protein
MSLADHVNAASAQTAAQVPRRVSAPTGWEPGVRYSAGEPVEVTVQVPSVPEDEKAWREEIKRVTGLVLPDNRRVEIQQVRYWGNPQEPLVYVRFGISDRGESLAEMADLAGLLKVVKANRRARNPILGTGRTRVVVLSDLQVGKVASGGGTGELLARIDDKMAQLVDLCRTEKCDDIVIVDPGDLIENDKNVNSQARTNDLTVPEQLHVARTILSAVVGDLAALHASTRVITVPSNHGQYRDSVGKGGGAGKPSDDFGIDIHRAVADQYKFAGRDDVTWLIPETWRESLAIDVRGTVLGVVHGHQFSPGQAGKWWAGQVHGDQPVAAASILLHGHYHNASMQQSGSLRGRPKWILGADALDGGSDWFQNITGEVSEPSITTFTITDAGWDNYRRIVSSPA